jgi:3-oxoadipate enol-lactonase
VTSSAGFARILLGRLPEEEYLRSVPCRVRVDGGELWAECAGSGTPVVLLHGAGGDSRLWDEVYPELARHCQVIRYDARGLGQSDPPDGPIWDVADLLGVLDHYGIERAVLVGMSMGGEGALDFTLAHPDRVSGLGLVGASVSGYRWPQAPELTDYTAARRNGAAERLAELELAIWASLGPQAPGWPTITAMVSDNAYKRLSSEKHALHADQDAFSRLEQIDVPALVVHGADDHPQIGVLAAALTARIPAARGEVIMRADHYLPLRTPGRLTELLLAHLATLARPA